MSCIQMTLMNMKLEKSKKVSRKFTEHAEKTAELYAQLYPWRAIPPPMHSILIHGSHYIRAIYIPIGQLSEEAAKARNKHFLLFWQILSQKFSGISCNQDVFNKLLLSGSNINWNETNNNGNFSNSWDREFWM